MYSYLILVLISAHGIIISRKFLTMMMAMHALSSVSDYTTYRRVIYFTNIGVTMLHNYEMKVKNTFISYSYYTLSIIYA